jgi:hypothetical protein
MRKVLLLVEGSTEERFVKNVLVQNWSRGNSFSSRRLSEPKLFLVRDRTKAAWGVMSGL